MYVISWYDGNDTQEVCTASPKTAFNVYLALKNSKKDERVSEGQYMFIYFRGHFCSIKDGIAMTPCDSIEDPKISLQEPFDN